MWTINETAYSSIFTAKSCGTSYRQKEAMMYLTSTLDLGNYVNKEILEILLNMKDKKNKQET